MPMPEEALHGVDVFARLEQMGGEGVPQGVDPALLDDAGAEFREHVGLLSDGDIDRTSVLAIGKEPDARRCDFPVRAQFLEKARGQRGVTVLGPLALFDADGHAIGVDVRNLERDGLTHPQAGGVHGHEQETVVGMRWHGEQAPHFLAAQDLG